MTGLENKLRAALRDTADEIPATPPPRRLPPERGPAWPGPAWTAQRRWISWAAPLAAAVLVLAVVAVSLAVVRGGSGRATSEPGGLAAVPPYYVALTAPAYPDVYDGNATIAEVRATATGAVLARVVPPKPYVHFAGVTAAADDRTFVLVAEAKSNPPTQQPKPGELPQQYYQPSRFYLLRFDPGTGRASLRALPAAFIPANAEVHDMALSPDGTSLAADIGPVLSGSRLVVFDLATGTERAWSFKTCARCNPSGGGLGYGGTNVDALSWTGDGRHVAFVGPNRVGWPSHSTVRLLDVTLRGSDLLANSRPVATLPPGDNATDLSWRGAIITPDGQTVVMIEELATDGAPIMVRDRLLKVSVTTGRVTVVNDLNVLAGYQYEQVMYTNAIGSVLVVSGARKGMTAGVVRRDRYTPIPWDRHIATAIW